MVVDDPRPAFFFCYLGNVKKEGDRKSRQGDFIARMFRGQLYQSLSKFKSIN